MKIERPEPIPTATNNDWEFPDLECGVILIAICISIFVSVVGLCCVGDKIDEIKTDHEQQAQQDEQTRQIEAIVERVLKEKQ